MRDLLEPIGICGFIVLLVLVVQRLVDGKFASREKPSRFDGEFYIMEYSMAEKFFTCFASVFFFGIAFFAGKSDPAQYSWSIAAFFSLGCLAVYLSVTRQIFKVLWNDSRISGTDALGRKQVVQWDELASVKGVPWGLGLQAKSGVCIIVAPKMIGFSTFMKKLDEECKVREIPWVGFPPD
jgi:hypothetical protein